MAHYRELTVQGETGWYLMSPSNIWEALHIAWMIWRHPNKASVLIGLNKEFMMTKCKPEHKPVQRPIECRDCPDVGLLTNKCWHVLGKDIKIDISNTPDWCPKLKESEMEKFNVSEVVVRVKVYHQFEDNGQSVRDIILNSLSFPAIQSLEIESIQLLETQEVSDSQ